MKSLTLKSRIVFGQTAFLAGLLVVANFAGLVPDQTDASRKSRAALVEAIAANSAMFVSETDIQRLRATLRMVVKHNEDILSAAVRRADGTAVATVGEHEANWSRGFKERSTDSEMQVPLWAGRHKWGKVEMRFLPLVQPGFWGIVNDVHFRLFCFIVLLNLAVSYAFVGEVLKHPDPRRSQV